MIPNKKLNPNINKEMNEPFNESVDDFQGETFFREAKRIKLKSESQPRKSVRTKLSAKTSSSTSSTLTLPVKPTSSTSFASARPGKPSSSIPCTTALSSNFKAVPKLTKDVITAELLLDLQSAACAEDETICPSCKSIILKIDLSVHLAICLKSFHKSITADYTNCDIDVKIKNDLKISSKKIDDPKVLPCPVCCKALSTTNQRISHLKKCAVQYGLSSERLLLAVRLQEKQAEDRASLGLPSAAPTTALKINEKKRKREKVYSPELDLACALSLSMVDKEAGQIQTEEDKLVEMGLPDVILQNRRERPPLLPSEDMEVKFAKTKRPPRKKLPKVTSILRSRTDEERQNILSEKLAAILLNEESRNRKPATPVRHSKYISSLISKECPTWEMSNAGEKDLDDYYVGELNKYIEPKFIEVGSLLKHFSQIPGRLNFTQIGKILEDDRDTIEDCSDDPEKTIADLYSTQLALEELLGSQDFLTSPSNKRLIVDTTGLELSRIASPGTMVVSKESPITLPVGTATFSNETTELSSSGTSRYDMSCKSPSYSARSALTVIPNTSLKNKPHDLIHSGSMNTFSPGIRNNKILKDNQSELLSGGHSTMEGEFISDGSPVEDKTTVTADVLRSNGVEMQSPTKSDENLSELVTPSKTSESSASNVMSVGSKREIVKGLSPVVRKSTNIKTESVPLPTKISAKETTHRNSSALSDYNLGEKSPLSVMQTNFICDWTRLLTSGTHSDIVIETADGDISVHSLVLRVRCPTLSEEAHSRRNQVVRWPTVAYETAFLFLAYLYTGQCSIGCEAALSELLALADRYCCKDLANLLRNSSPRKLIKPNKAITPRNCKLKDKNVVEYKSKYIYNSVPSSPDIFGDSLTNEESAVGQVMYTSSMLGNPYEATLEQPLSEGTSVEQPLSNRTTVIESPSGIKNVEKSFPVEVLTAVNESAFRSPRRDNSLLSNRSINTSVSGERQGVVRRKLYLESSKDSLCEASSITKGRQSVVDLTSNSSDSNCNDSDANYNESSISDQLLTSFHNKSKGRPNISNNDDKSPYKVFPGSFSHFQPVEVKDDNFANLELFQTTTAAKTEVSLGVSGNFENDYVTNVWDDFDDGAVCGFQEITPIKPPLTPCKNILHTPLSKKKCLLSPIKSPIKLTSEAKTVNFKATTHTFAEDDIGDETLLNAVMLTEKTTSMAGPNHRRFAPQKGFATPQNLLKQGADITPMLSYKTMITPELKRELDKYGIRKLSRNKAIKLLVHIYDEMHPVVTDSEASFCDSPLTDRRLAVIEPESPEKDISDLLNSSLSSITSCSSMGDNGEFEASIFGMEEEDDEEITVTQKQSLNDQISAYIKSDAKLYKTILQYDPIWIKDLQKSLKDAGIKCSSKKLTDYLDEQCITFRFTRNPKIGRLQCGRRKWKK